MNEQPLNREGWLHAFAEEIAPLIKARTGRAVPLSRVRLACSFPNTRATPNRSGGFTTGRCFHGDDQKSGLFEILINPLVDEAITEDNRGVAETVIHELIHASLDKGVGHKAPFARAAKKMGLEGKPTSTILSDELKGKVEEILKKIGPYPHKAIDVGGGTKQTTRLLKVYCEQCNYTTRITRKWLEDAGAPICPTCYTNMTEQGEEDGVILKTVESHMVYSVPMADSETIDPRFQIRHTMSGKIDSWTVVDFGEAKGKIVKATGPDGNEVEVELAPLGTVVPRIVAAEGRQDALDMISGVREGLYSWDDLEDDQTKDDWDDDDYLDEDEDEINDNPEDQQPDEWTHPMTGEKVLFNYDDVAATRE